MRLLRAFTLRNYVTLTLFAVALFAVLGSGLSRVSGSREIADRLTAPGDLATVTALPNGNDTGITLNPLARANPNERNDEFNLRLRSASIASPFAAALTATKTDNTSALVNPGDTIMYTVEITNTGDVAATNVNFTDTIDANTTLVAGSVAVAPIAVNDAYNTIGNVNIQVPVGQGVITNDLNPNGSGTLSVTLVNATPVPGTAATTNGSVTMASDGSFTYTPNAGFTGANDTFTYTLGNSATPGKTDTATVTIAVAGRIWFVNSAAGVNGDGRLNTPFNILTGAGSADSVDAANDVIFLFSSGTNYTGGITLNSGEKIIGQGASQTILAITGFATPSGNNLLPATGGSDPVIVTAGTVAITLGTNNGLHGFTVGNTGAAGTDIAGTSFGTLTVRDVSVNGTGRALNLATGTIAAASTFDLIETTGGDDNEGARLNAVGGSFTTPTTNIVNPTSVGLDVQSSPAGTSFSFGATTVNKGATAGTGVNLNANSGTFSFSSLTVTTSNGTGVSATSSGTVNVTTGSIAATGGPALLVNPTTLGMTFTSLSSTTSPTTGVSLTSASGSLTTGTTTVTNAAGIGILVQSLAGAATVSFGTTSITNPDANTTGGTGVNLVSNAGSVSFGDLDITPETGQRGLHATGNTGTITSLSGDILAVNGTAVEIVGPSAASRTPLNMTLTRTSATASGGNPPNGIVLQNVNGPGASVGFVVTGGASTAVGGDASGGTISSTSGADGGVAGNGIYLENADEVTLRRITINGTNTNHGIRGVNASNLIWEFSTVSGTNGTSIALDEGSVNFDNLTGAAAITSCLIEGGLEDNLNVVNTSGMLNRLVITGSTFGFNNTVSGNNNILIESQNAGTTLNFTLQSSIIKGARADWLNASNNSSSTMDMVIGGSTLALGNTFDNLGVNAHPGAAAGGNRLVTGSVGPATVDIRNNTLKGSKGEAIRVRSTATGALTGAVDARVRNNTIGVAGTANSGSSEGSGIFIFVDGGGDADVSITNNSIFQYNNHAINLQAGDEINDGTVFNATVTGNTANTPGNINTDFNGIQLNHGTVAATDNFTGCVDIGGAGLQNNVVGSGAIAPNNASIRLRQRQSTTVRLPGYGGANNDDAAVVAYLLGRNTVATAAASNTVPTGGGFIGGAACTQPSVASSPALEISSMQTQSEGATAETSYRDILFAPEANSANQSATGVRHLDLLMIAEVAIGRWEQLGVSGEDLERLKAVQFEIADLPDDQLAITTPTKIIIDETAADYGWFIDPTPDRNEEFQENRAGQLKAKDILGHAFDRMDLLTAVTRSLDYVLEHEWWSRSINRIDLMQQTLPPSTRRVSIGMVSPPRPLPAPVKQISMAAPAPADVTPKNQELVASTTAGSVGIGGQVSQSGETQGEELASRAGLPKSAFSNSALTVTPAVFNPGTDLKPGDYSRSARRMSYSPNARPVAASPAAPFSGETINLGPFTLPPGEKIVIMFSATVNAANTFPPGTTQVCNQGSVSATGIPAFLTDDPDVVGSNDPTCTALNVADVSVTKSAGSSPICSTSNITFTINYSNAGPAAAIDAVVSDAMPVGTSLVSVTTPATWTRTDLVPVGGNGTITFTKASSPNADAAVFTIVVSIDAGVTDGTVIQNTASVTSTTPDPNTANNTTAPTSTTVKKPPTTATVGGPQTICALGTTASLGGNTPVIGTGLWTVQSGGTGTFNPDATTPGATFTHLTGTGPVVLRWTISNQPCPDSFAEVTITINAQPTATVGGPQTICALGTTASLGGNTPSGGATGTWTIVTAGVVGTFNPTANTPGATFTHTSGGIGTTITLRWTVSNPPCTDATADVLVTIKSQPSATVGGPQTICATGTTAGLGGNTPAAGETGTWSIVTAGVVGTFNPNANTPNATFTHTSGPGPFTLRWTVSNPPCTDATADVVITLLPAPVATTGGPQTICELGTTASLGGNTPAAGETGTWSIVTAGVTGTFNPDANTPGATFTHISGGAGGTITLRWTVTNPTCGQSATADALITVNQQPAATVGGPQTICALGTTAGLGGNTPAGGATGTWTIVTAGATGTFNPSANTPNATFTHTAGTGMITLRWTIANPPCTESFAEVIITVNQQPVATVGGSQTICALGTTAGLGGNTPTGGATGTWTIVTAGATGAFNPNANTPNATFTHTAGTGAITLRWTVSNPSCVDATADVVITITQPPTTATVGPNQTILPLGTTAGLGGNTPSSGTGLWSIVTAGATGTFNPDASTPNATWTHATGSGVIVLRWTITNPPCPDSFADVSIQVGVPPMITCPTSPVVANTAPGQCSATVTFTVTATGTPPATVMCTPPSGSTFPVGNTTVNCTATNGILPNAMCSFTVQVNDTEGPQITLTTGTIELWPPNHNYTTITMSQLVASVTDNCSVISINNVKITSVSSDEPENVPGKSDGNTVKDIVIAANCKSVKLRAERDDNLDGRVYTINLKVKDGSGNVTTASRTVVVPVNQSGDGAILGPGPGYTITSSCP